MRPLDRLPKDWQWVKFGNVIAESQPGFASGQRDSKGVIQLRMNNVDTRGNLLWNEFIRVPADSAAIEKFRLKVGDVVFNNTNSTELVGKSALFTGHDEPVTYSNHFTRLRTRPDIADPGFITFWLISQWQAKTFANICNRWIGQSAVKTDKLFSLEIPLPPLAEQRRIASRLNEQLAAVESARKAAEEQLQAAYQLPSVYLRDAFESKEAKSWNTVKLGDIVSVVQNGIYKTADFYGHGHPFLRMYNLSNRTWNLIFEKMAQVEINEQELSTYRLRKGDLLFSRVNSFELVGKCAWVDETAENFVFENMLIRVRLSDGVDSLFVSQQMQTPYIRKQIEVVAKRAIGQSSINSNDLRELKLVLPLLSTQIKISEQIDNQFMGCDQLIKLLESQLAEIESLPASLLREAFAGEV